jgi:hypothetical protein
MDRKEEDDFKKMNSLKARIDEMMEHYWTEVTTNSTNN